MMEEYKIEQNIERIFSNLYLKNIIDDKQYFREKTNFLKFIHDQAIENFSQNTQETIFIKLKDLIKLDLYTIKYDNFQFSDTFITPIWMLDYQNKYSIWSVYLRKSYSTNNLFQPIIKPLLDLQKSSFKIESEQTSLKFNEQYEKKLRMMLNTFFEQAKRIENPLQLNDQEQDDYCNKLTTQKDLKQNVSLKILSCLFSQLDETFMNQFTKIQLTNQKNETISFAIPQYTQLKDLKKSVSKQNTDNITDKININTTLEKKIIQDSIDENLNGFKVSKQEMSKSDNKENEPINIQYKCIKDIEIGDVKMNSPPSIKLLFKQFQFKNTIKSKADHNFLSSSVIQLKQPKYYELKGLPNLGNTCYINASLQALRKIVYKYPERISQSQFGQQLIQLFDKLDQNMSINDELSQIVDYIKQQKHHTPNGGDSYISLFNLVYEIQKTIPENQQSNLVEDCFYIQKNEYSQCLKCFYLHLLEHNEEKELGIEVENLGELNKQPQQTEENNYSILFCTKCGINQIHKQRTRFERLPYFLFVKINNNEDRLRTKYNVELDKIFSIKEISSDVNYKIIGFCNYLTSHYTYTALYEDKWVNFSDNSVFRYYCQLPTTLCADYYLLEKC